MKLNKFVCSSLKKLHTPGQSDALRRGKTSQTHSFFGGAHVLPGKKNEIFRPSVKEVKQEVDDDLSVCVLNLLP